jgi:hypothetical protein
LAKLSLGGSTVFGENSPTGDETKGGDSPAGDVSEEVTKLKSCGHTDCWPHGLYLDSLVFQHKTRYKYVRTFQVEEDYSMFSGFWKNPEGAWSIRKAKCYPKIWHDKVNNDGNSLIFTKDTYWVFYAYDVSDSEDV